MISTCSVPLITTVRSGAPRGASASTIALDEIVVHVPLSADEERPEDLADPLCVRHPLSILPQRQGRRGSETEERWP